MAKTFYEDFQERKNKNKLLPSAVNPATGKLRTVQTVRDLHAGEEIRKLPEPPAAGKGSSGNAKRQVATTQTAKTVSDLHAGENTKKQSTVQRRVNTVNDLHAGESVRTGAAPTRVNPKTLAVGTVNSLHAGEDVRTGRDMGALVSNQMKWHQTKNEEERARLHTANDAIRARYGLSYNDDTGRTVGRDGADYSTLTVQAYGRPSEEKLRLGLQGMLAPMEQRAAAAQRENEAAAQREQQLSQRLAQMSPVEYSGLVEPMQAELQRVRQQMAQMPEATGGVGAPGEYAALVEREAALKKALADIKSRTEQGADALVYDAYGVQSGNALQNRTVGTGQGGTFSAALEDQLAKMDGSTILSRAQFLNGLQRPLSDAEKQEADRLSFYLKTSANIAQEDQALAAQLSRNLLAKSSALFAGYQGFGDGLLFGAVNSDTMQKPLDMGGAEWQALKAQTGTQFDAGWQAHPVASAAGTVGGSLYGTGVLYGTAGKAIRELPALSKISNPFARSVVAGQLADTAISTPLTALSSAIRGKDAQGVAKDVAIDQAISLLGNVGIAGAEAYMGARRAQGTMPRPVAEDNPIRPNTAIETNPIDPKTGMIPQIRPKKPFVETPGAKSYADQIDGVFSGALPIGQTIDAGATPEILQQYGANPLRMTMTQNTARKIAYPENYMGGKHNLGIPALKQIPAQLSDPVAILKSQTQKDSLVVLTEWLDAHGDPVIVPVHLNKNGAVEIENAIASAYGRPRLNMMLGENGSNILYIKNNESLSQRLSHGLQLPEATADDSLVAHSIARNAENIKPKAHEIVPEELANMQSRPPSVGAADLGFDPYARMQNDYGTIRPGEAPRAREVDVPVSTDGTDRVSRYARTLMEAEATPDKLLAEYERNVKNGLFSHNVKKDADSLDKAVRSITEQGYWKSKEQWDNVVKGYRTAKKDDIVLAQMLYAEAAKAGDTQTAMKLAAEIAAEGTRAGQNVQAMRLLKKLTPEGKLYYAQRSVANLQKDLQQQLGTAAQKIQIDENLAKQLLQAADDKQMRAAMDAIMENVAGQLPKTFSSRVDAWRYFAMLGNPRTHIRNIVGNIMFMIPRKTKNAIGTVLEKGLPVGERTKAIFKNGDMTAFARKDYTEMKDVLSSSSKYSTEQMIRDKQKLFPGPIDWTMKASSRVLDAEDTFFKRSTYIDSLSQFLTANKAKLTELPGSDLLEQGRTYAVLEAQKATFQDASRFATRLGELERSSKTAKVLIGGLVPFKKTPINIVKRGVDYSPLGLAKGIVEMTIDVKRGTKTAAQAIDRISAGLSGTGIMALGGYLASRGIISGASDDDRKKAAFDEMQGAQEYALNIGDHTYTVDWSAPASLPLFVGAELYKAWNGGAENFTLGSFLDAIGTITEPVFNLTMMDGISGAIKSAGYAGSNPVSAMAANTVQNYAGQVVPTVLGQINRTFFDDTRRTTYSEKNTPLGKGIDTFLQRQQAKIPGLSQKLLPRLDAFGRTDTDDNLVRRAFENFLSPGYISDRRTTPAETELERLYTQTGDSAVLPGAAAKSFTVDGQTTYLTAPQYLTFASTRGKTALELLGKTVESTTYKNMDDMGKAALVADLYDYATANAKTQVSSYQLDGWMKNAKAAEQTGVPVWAYATYRSVYSAAKEDENTPTYADRLTLVDRIASDGTLKDGEKNNLIASLVISGISEQQLAKYHGMADKVSAETYARTYCSFDEIDDNEEKNSSDKNASKRQLLFDDNSLTAEQKSLLDKALIRDATFIPKDMDVNYTDATSFTVSQMSDAAQKKFPGFGMSAEDYAKYYPLAAAQKKKAECIQDLQDAGMSYAKAAQFYAQIKSRGSSKSGGGGKKSSRPSTIAGLRSKYLSY